MKAALVILALMIQFLPSGAQASDGCEFIPRKSLSELMSALPVNVIGWVSCADKAPTASVFVVAQFKSLDEASFETFVETHARLMDHSSAQASVAWRSNQPLDRKQILIKTWKNDRNGRSSDVMSHYSFVTTLASGEHLVFVHSLSERESNRTRDTLDKLHLALSDSKFTDTISELAAALAAR